MSADAVRCAVQPAHDRVLEQAAAWRDAGQRVAIATLIRTWGASPRPVGAQMAIAEQGATVGSVSAGCVEAAVIHEASKLFTDGEPRRLTFGATDDRAWEVGLPCGGRLEVYLEPLE